MTESLSSHPSRLVVPPGIQAIIDAFEQRNDTFTCADVSAALNLARTALKAPTPEENKGAWADVLAFALAAGSEHTEKPWGTYFGPMGSGTRDGEIVYFPDARQADSEILGHWIMRANTTVAPVLRARFSDLVWDMSRLIAKEKSRIEFAHNAIDSYLVAVADSRRDIYDAFPDAKRALALAIQIGDQTRRDAARAALLWLHKQAVNLKKMWWVAYDALLEQPKAGLSNIELECLVSDIETVLARAANTANPAEFDPHEVEAAANRLIGHYRRKGDSVQLQRLNLNIAHAFEHSGGMGDPLTASMVLQTSMDAYRAAGNHAEADRILSLIEQSILASAAQMTTHEYSVKITKEEIDEFVAQIITDTKEETFNRIVGEFLVRRSNVEKSLKDSAVNAPLLAKISQTKIKGDRIVATIGSIDEDPDGRRVAEASNYLSILSFWLGTAFRHAQERHAVTGDDLVAFANRTGLFGDGRLLHAGITAWLENDHVKAAHVLVPQIEAGFRRLLGLGGLPTTRPHPQMKQARMALTFGEMLFRDDTAAILGARGVDIALQFRALYADPRGHNLRNELSHGLVAYDSLNAEIMLWVIHSVLLLGAILKPKVAQKVDPTAPDHPKETA